jgi:hypothetical protein
MSSPAAWMDRSVGFVFIHRRLQKRPHRSVSPRLHHHRRPRCVAQFAFACVIRLQLIHETAHILLHADVMGGICLNIKANDTTACGS